MVSDYRPHKSSMKITTHEESLQYDYSAQHNIEEKKRVTFNNIIIREYRRALGDNPSVTFGPPMSIGWEYGSERSISFEDHNEMRRKYNFGSGVKILSRAEREDLLLLEGYQIKDLRNAVRDVMRTQRARRTTVNNYEIFTALEKIAERTKRRLKHVIIRRVPVINDVGPIRAISARE
mmetsp:Transcript_51965/g.62592  ORF Transcript_51965/g.62592 Transcript_51965/m.62592 type:complete len:178 (+) Transcript_51965:101-634(+)